MESSGKKGDRRAQVEPPREAASPSPTAPRSSRALAFGDRKAPPPRQKVDRLKAALRTVAEVREKKIAPIKRALAQGTYRVDPDAVARSVVDEAASDAVHRGKCGLDRWPQDAD